MRLSLTARLTMAFIGVVLTMALLAGIFVRRANIRQITQLITKREKEVAQQEMEAYYEQNGSWDGVAAYITANRENRPAAQQPPAPRGNGRDSAPPPPPRRGKLFGAADINGVIVVPLPPTYRAGTQVPDEILKAGEPLMVHGEQVGTLLPLDVTPGLTAQEAEFLQVINNALLVGVLGAAFVAVVASFLLTRTLTRPLRELTAVAETIAQGKLGEQVPVRSKDEVGNLAVAFNQMSHDLAEANRLRRQMTADIAHDLRTPLTVLGGYLESMREGLLKPTPKRLELMYTEVGNMERLIRDLRTLSQADAGELTLNLQTVNPGEIVERVAKAYEFQAEQKDVVLATALPESLPLVKLDTEQMTRVLGNLISNALRYTPQNGRIALSATAVSKSVKLQVRDNGTGIEPKHLPYIFHRFYRIDKSRQSEHGESGLGLAIVKSIVEAHGGQVSAHSDGLERGTTFTIMLPAV